MCVNVCGCVQECAHKCVGACLRARMCACLYVFTTLVVLQTNHPYLHTLVLHFWQPAHLLHRRFPVGPIAELPALKRIAVAHQIHHGGGISCGIVRSLLCLLISYILPSLHSVSLLHPPHLLIPAAI
jgi:hypothetical protein